MHKSAKCKRVSFDFTIEFDVPSDELTDLYAELVKRRGNVSSVAAAGVLGISSRALSKTVKKLTGTTYRQLRVEVKMQIARLLLTETNLPIDQIAENVGYTERSNFERTFRRIIGHTPFFLREHQR
jgi:AraC-like DNA-binding protein